MTAARTAIACAHPNIALAKYWGKVPGGANAPAVPSLSVTLAGMQTRTRLTVDPALESDALELNGAPADSRALARATELLDRVRARAGSTARARISSTNDFPTAAGLASSASGFAALGLAAYEAYGVPIDLSAVSDLARRSSASSARSLFGGYVELAAGAPRDAVLSARPVAPPEALPLVVLVAVTTEAKKDVASTDGMNRTAKESPYYPAWVAHAPTLFAEVRAGVLAGDLPRVGVAAEASALAMHASAIAAGIVYFRGATVDVLAEVRAIRAAGTGAWATIDAGPHVKVLVAPSDAAAVTSRLSAVPGVLRVLEARPGPGATVVESGP
jgi:diphosphomevalonate decarboxylase